MIQLQRPAAPASLRTPAIRQYLADCAQYAADCTAAADPRTVAEPKKPGSYRHSDVLAIFEHEDYFYAKCYLTEQGFGSAWEMDVDHFVPVNQDPSLCYEWTNLFPAAHKANMMRPRTWPPGGLLDPCRDPVETALVATIGVLGQAPHFAAVDAQNAAARNTADLLNLLHNGRASVPNSQENTVHLRVAIAHQYDKVLRSIIKFLAARNADNPQVLTNARRELGELLSRRASFTMLMRAMDPVVAYVPADLLD